MSADRPPMTTIDATESRAASGLPPTIDAETRRRIAAIVAYDLSRRPEYVPIVDVAS